MEKLKNPYNGFKLISLELKWNTFLGTISFDFVDTEDKQDAIYSTVIIGPNGTGKSNLFRIVINLFKELYDLSLPNGKRSYLVNGDFSLKYSIDECVYEFTNIKKASHLATIIDKVKVYLYKDGKIIDFKGVKFPIAIVANSIMLTDKYPVFNNEKVFPVYKYLGIRNRAQNASTRQYVRKTVEFIVEQYDNESFRRGLKSTTEFLEMVDGIEIIYNTANTSLFFNGELYVNQIDKYFQKIQAKYEGTSSTPPFKLNSYLSMKNEGELHKVCYFCNDLVKKKRLERKAKRSSKYLSYDLVNEKSFDDLKKEFGLLEKLRLLGAIYPPEIRLKRIIREGSFSTETNYDLRESSSGEYHFFSTMVGLLATVKPNSLIFIDEPEASLHPNWQMKYISFLRQLFSGEEFASSHIMLATHSHFIVSDLKAENSNIIGLNRTDKIEIVELPKHLDTYSWSAEEILYNIFKVKTVRNYFFEAELTDLLGLISEGSKNRTEIQRLLGSIKSIKISPNDPLNGVIEETEEYLKTI